MKGLVCPALPHATRDANFARMTDTPMTEAPAPEGEVIDTSPAAPERTAVTYGILLIVLAALLVYFMLHAVRRH